MTTKYALKEILPENCTSPIYLFSECRPETVGEPRMKLILLDSLEAYEGTISSSHILSFANNIKMSQEKFTQLMNSAFTFDSEVEDHTELCFATNKDYDSGKMDLVWKKVSGTDDSKIKISLGSVEMTAIDAVSANQKVLSKVAQQMQEKHNSNQVSEKGQKNMEKECNKVQDVFKKCTQAKIESEQELFSKFSTVLNQKKAKIRELKQKLADKNNTKDDSTEANVSNPSTSSVSKPSTSKNDSYGSSTEHDSDDSPRRKKVSKKTAGKEKRKSSLDLADQVSDDEKVQPGKRKIIRNAAKVQKVASTTESRNVIVPNTRQTRSQKSQSQNSHRTCSADTVDLLDDM